MVRKGKGRSCRRPSSASSPIVGTLLLPTVLRVKSAASTEKQVFKPHTLQPTQVLKGQPERPSFAKSPAGLCFRQRLHFCQGDLSTVEAARFRGSSGGSGILYYSCQTQYFGRQNVGRRKDREARRYRDCDVDLLSCYHVSIHAGQ
jgi:hypothetical protein